MAPTKRKTEPTNSLVAQARSIVENAERPLKKIRREQESTKTASGGSNSNSLLSSKVDKSQPSSIKKDDETPFPRGGASVLTPLEHKQIQIEATRDALFEQQNASKDEPNESKRKDSSKLKKKKNKSGNAREESKPEEDLVKIEGLSYKRLVPGSLVLGQVSQINPFDIALALPNNLTGYVPFTSISDKFTARLERILSTESQPNEDAEDEEDIDPKQHFFLGQYLRAMVVSASDDGAEKATEPKKRRIELSLRPQDANSGISTNELIAHSTVMASVVSVEDHGIIMDLGLSNLGVRGFLSSKETDLAIRNSALKEGDVVLCMITGLSSNGKIIKLSANMPSFANTKKFNYLVEGPTVDAFLPGTAVELLVTDVTRRGVVGKVMGMIDVTADVVHSRVDSGLSDISKKYQIGSKVKARIIYKHPAVETHKLGVSFLDNLMALSIQTTLKDKTPQDPLDVLPLSSVIEAVTVKRVEPGVGLFVDVGLKGIPGFVHISRIAEKKIETLDETTGPYKVGSTHRARVIGYNSVDGLYLLSTEPRVLEQAFLRIEDLKIGEVVKGTVEKLVVNASGVGGVLVTLADGITGLVPEMHMSDVALLHPEKRFKAGMKVTARVVSTDPGKRKIRLTLKKSLVNSEAAPIRSYAEITLGAQSPGTIVNILPSGAVVQFYGTIRGFLPVSEMSEAYIQDPKQHFRVGQVVNVRVIGVDASAERMTVSCKDPAALTLEQKAAFKATNIGDVVSAVVTEKSTDGVRVELPLSSLRGVLHIGHLSDSSDVKNAAALKKLRVGQTLQDLVVLEKVEQNYSVVLTHKPSIIQAVREQTFPRDFSEVAEGKLVYGFVKRTTDSAVILQFGGRLTGLIPNTHLPKEALSLPDFGFKRHDSVAARVLAVDAAQQRFLLTLKSDTSSTDARRSETAVHHDMPVSSPIDSAIKSMNDFSLGRVTKARIISVKETQINVQLADGVQGRIDVSQVFDSWDEIKDRKHPLRSFAPKQVISVRILGIHDARNHRFLAITHRTGKTPVFELSAKPSDQGKEESGALSLDKIEVGSTFIAFVNNILDDCLWVNLSPGVRGRITALDITDDVSLLKDIEANFPIGSAIRVRVTGVDISNNKLDLSARIGQTGEALTFRNLNRGTVVPGKVTRVTDRQVMVQLSENVSGPVNLPDLADDFAQANPMAHARNDIVRVCVVEVDPPNKRIRLSMRPSRTLNSALPVVDPELISIDQLKVNDVVRGFVKNVADNGIFVNFGGSVTGYVRISDLSDSYIKDWKSAYQVDQLVKGKVIAVDKARNQVQLSLKSSVLDANYVAPLTFNDLTVGQVVTGKVRKVEEFGVFVVIDGSSNLSGLCHKSEMADGKVESAKKLYEEGDVVQAKILKLDPERKRISFGLKASYFDSELGDDDDSEDDTSDEMQGVLLDPESDSNDDEMNDDSEQAALVSADAATKSATELSVGAAPSGAEDGVAALNAGGFDWTGNMLDDAAEDVAGASVDASNVATKKKHRKAAIQVDRTGDLDTDGPQTLADFERLLLGQHNSSQLWIEYMAYHVKLSELVKAREIGERALRTIDIREESEKMNIWTAMLNIENEFGTKETLEEVFLRACQYNDPQEISERLATIYIQSGKHENADELFQASVKKFSQSPSVWYNYAHFLHNTYASPERARVLLPRAIQSLPTHAHIALTVKFAALEFHSPNGSPELGRTIFEGVLSTFPKRMDLWNQLLDLEIHQGILDIIRALFERVTKIKGLKPKSVKAWFKRWQEWEEANGESKTVEKVHLKAQEWVRNQ